MKADIQAINVWQFYVNRQKIPLLRIRIFNTYLIWQPRRTFCFLLVDGYRISDVTSQARRLKGKKLLLVHGTAGMYHSSATNPNMLTLWQYGLWSFQTIFTQRKLLNFEFWINSLLSKSAKICLQSNFLCQKSSESFSFFFFEEYQLRRKFLLSKFFAKTNFTTK